MSIPKQIPALTAIRGLAAWWVVLFHFKEEIPGIAGTPVFTVAAHGYLAVDLFFELSGFVIALNYALMFANVSWSDTLRFLSLRIARIYPLHLFMLLLFVINPVAIMLFSTSKDLGDWYDLNYFVLSLALMQNWGFTNHLAWNIPAWSLSTEWAAYLAFPVLAWLSLNWVRTALHAALMAIALLVLLIVISVATGESLGGQIARLGLVRCILEFWMGSSLYYLLQMRRWRVRQEGNIVSVAAGLLAIGYILWPVPDFFVFPLMFLLLIWALTDQHALVSRLLSNRGIELIGTVSYSTYLVHYFVKDWVKFLLVEDRIHSMVPFYTYISTTALASFLLYHWIEVPWRRRLRLLLTYGQRRSA